MSRIKQVFKHWIKVDGSVLSAAVSFYAALALFPVLVVLLSIFGWSLANSQDVQEWRVRILDLITEQTSQQFAEIVESQLSQIEDSARLTGSIGILSLFAFSMAFFSKLERSFCTIWQLPRETFGLFSSLKRIIFDRIRAYLVILLLFLIVVINFVFSIYLEKVEHLISDTVKGDYSWWLMQIAGEVALNVILFTGIFQIMTREKVKWGHAMFGALVTAVLWQPGRYLIATFLISGKYTPFGVVGAFWAVLLWIYYVTSIMLFGGTVVYITGLSQSQPKPDTTD